MKARVVLFLSLILISCYDASAQTEILFGEIQRDGYEKVTKGAYWLSRPEAKAVYYGQDVPSVKIITLDSDHFVRFAKGENNPLDINYIVFPKGEKIYKKNGQFYAAICGNRIDFLQPVTLVVVKENNYSSSRSEDISFNNGPIKKSQDYYIEPKKENGQNFVVPIENQNKKKKFKVWHVVVPVLVGILAYSLWKGNKSSPDDNVPGPAPTTPGDTGGPGGAPSSPGGGG